MAEGTISGLLNVNKPGGITSHDVVRRVRRLANQRKVGHAGTLDPLATGVLVVALGRATRLLEYVVGRPKKYRATIHFGLETDTLDADGRVTTRRDPAGLAEAQLREILPNFLGEVEQTPPIFSALKQDGQPLYKLARRGQPVQVEPRRVTIYGLDWLAWQPPRLKLEVTCSTGTYIRSLAADLGRAAGPGAHLAELTRLAVGPWLLDQAVALDRLEAEGWQPYLQPLDRAVSHLPPVELGAEQVRGVGYGQQVALEMERTGPVRAYTPAGDFLAILTPVESSDKLWQPKKVFG